MVRDGHREVDRPAPANLDGLAPHLGLPPLVAELVPRRVGGVEALDEDVLVVGHRVRDAPGHVAVVAEVGQAGDAGEREPDGVEVRAGEVVLVVAVRRVERAVRIARDERAARGGPGPGEDPVVAPADPGRAGEPSTAACSSSVPTAAGRRPAGLGAGRNDQHGRLGRARRQVGGQPGAELPHQPGAPELHLPGPHLDVPDLEDGEAVRRRPRLGAEVEELELDRPGLGRGDEGVDAGRVRVEHRARLGRRDLVVDAGAPLEPEAPGERILRHADLADQLRPAPGRPAAVVLHVPEPILGVDEALREERVVDGPGPRVGDALGDLARLDGAGEAAGAGGSSSDRGAPRRGRVGSSAGRPAGPDRRSPPPTVTSAPRGVKAGRPRVHAVEGPAVPSGRHVRGPSGRRSGREATGARGEARRPVPGRHGARRAPLDLRPAGPRVGALPRERREARYPTFTFPYSHGLVASLAWSAIAVALVRVAGRSLGAGLVVGGDGVLPLRPGCPRPRRRASAPGGRVLPRRARPLASHRPRARRRVRARWRRLVALLRRAGARRAVARRWGLAAVVAVCGAADDLGWSRDRAASRARGDGRRLAPDDRRAHRARVLAGSARACAR